MEFIGSLYYISGIFALIRLIYSFRDFSRISDLKEWAFRFSSLTGRKPSSKDYGSKAELDMMNAHVALDIFEWIWVACGLLSGNSAIFAAIIMLGIAYKYVSAHISFGWLYKSFTLLFISARFLLYLAMISNHFFHNGGSILGMFQP